MDIIKVKTNITSKLQIRSNIQATRIINNENMFQFLQNFGHYWPLDSIVLNPMNIYAFKKSTCDIQTTFFFLGITLKFN